MADCCPLECNTCEGTFCIFDFRYAKELTILHATYSLIASPATCESQSLGQSLTRLHCPTQIRASREKHIHYGLRRRVHPQCRGSHAVREFS